MRCEKCAKRIESAYFTLECLQWNPVELDDLALRSEVVGHGIPYNVYLCKRCWFEFKEWIGTRKESNRI